MEHDHQVFVVILANYPLIGDHFVSVTFINDHLVLIYDEDLDYSIQIPLALLGRTMHIENYRHIEYLHCYQAFVCLDEMCLILPF